MASMSTAVGVVIATNSGFNNKVFAINRASENEDYTLVLDSNNKIGDDNSVLTSSGNKIQFAFESSINKNPSTGWIEFGDGETSTAIYNSSAIKGMKSISFIVNYSDIDLHFGYKEDDIIHYSNWFTMTGLDQGNGKYSFEYEFNEVRPSYFKLECFSKNKIIDSITIEYSCEESGIVPTELSSFSSFTYLEADDGYRVDGLVNNRKKMQTLIVPGTYNNKPVVEIANNAFYLNWDIEYVIINEGVKRIGSQAFYLDATLKYIVLPSTIESVGDKAFEGCAGIKTQTIPAGTTNISLSAYSGNSFLEEIIVEEGNPNYYSDNGMLYEKSSDTLLICPAGKKGAITILNTCKAIGSVAFKNSLATSITIGIGVREIHESFRTCKSLTTFVVDSNNDYYATSNNMLCDKLIGTVFAYARGNTTVVLNMPSTVRVIGDNVFEGVSSVKAINLSGTTHVGECAFASMPDLESIGGTSLVEIENGAFKNNPKLNTVGLSSNLQVLPEEAFMNCTSLSSISFPHSLTTISARAFKGCSSLEEIELPDYLFASLGNEAFMNCASLDVDALPSCISTIGTDVFRNTATDSVVVPTSFDYIADGMYRDCDNLVSITIPEFIETIGYDSFRDCNNLTDVTILDNSVKTIRSRAFYQANFNTIFIPKCVEIIEGSALNTGRVLTIYTDQKTPSGYGDTYTPSSAGGGWLKPGWSEGLAGAYLGHIYYNQSRS